MSQVMELDERWSLRHELNRKVFETVEWLVVGLDKARFTPEQFSMGMNTLFMAVSGIADEDFISIVTESQKECEDVRPHIKRSFHAPDEAEINSIRWNVGSDRIVTFRLSFGLAHGGIVKDFDTAKEARAFVDKFATLMLSKGWVEL